MRVPRHLGLSLLLILVPSTVFGFVYYYSFFKDPIYYPVSAEPLDIAVGDLNLDGLNDVVVATRSGRRIHVLMGNGDGTLTETAVLEPGRGASSAAIGDMNSDGRPDIVASICNLGCTKNALIIYHGAGDGSFTPGPVFEAQGVPYNVLVNDFDGDGFLDVAASDYPQGRVQLYLTDGVPEEFNVTYLAAAAGTVALESADLNRDGWPDLVAANHRAGALSVFLNSTDGSMSEQLVYKTGELPYAVSLEYMDSDPFVDVVVAHSSDPGSVSIHRGDGNGSFIPAGELTLSDRPVYVFTEDANGDERPDILLTYHKQNSASLYLNRDDSSLIDPLEFRLAADREIYSAAITYLDEDPFPDLVTGNFEQNVVSVSLGRDPALAEAAPAGN